MANKEIAEERVKIMRLAAKLSDDGSNWESKEDHIYAELARQRLMIDRITEAVDRLVSLVTPRL